MNHSSEIRSLSDSMASLVSTLTEIINAKVKAANAAENLKANSMARNTAPGMIWTEAVAQEKFIGFQELCQRIPLSERTLREAVRRGRIPSIRMPRSRRVLFHWNSVQKALLRFQRDAC